MGDRPLLEVNQLSTMFKTTSGVYSAVDEVSFNIAPRETVCLVGESGCGKSVTALSIMGLLPELSGVTTKGEIRLAGQELLSLSQEEMRKIRGKEVSMIFQEPMTSLNPVFTVGAQVMETVLNHDFIEKSLAMEKTVSMLQQVGIPKPKLRAAEYPHLFSGGMRQRVMIAMALICQPKLLIADEPTTALDVTIQAQILNLMKELKEVYGTSILLITHDLGVVAEVADRVMVMYAGEIVEVADVFSIFAKPYHPYTEGLLNSLPRLDQPGKYLSVIRGTVPTLRDMPQGCKFSPRCPYANQICRNERPTLQTITADRQAACWHTSELRLKGVEAV